MARNPKDAFPCGMIYGIPNSYRWTPYHDLNEVLNTIGVMAKRSEIPSVRITHLPRKKQYSYGAISGLAYIVPKDWRNCLYEDLETGDYYIISPHPENEKYDYKYHYCWIAFKLSGITDGITHYLKDYTGNYIRDNSGKRIKEILHHTGSFIDLVWRCNLNEILDTLAKNQKPIVIKCVRSLYTEYNNNSYHIGDICQFDI